MNYGSDQAGSIDGLRERKKAKTKAAIRREAVRLFRDRGYAATTVEQIAAAAEVAPSTVFRYFPTKQDLILTDDYDLPFVVLFQAQPPELGPIEAGRRAVRKILSEMPDAELAAQRDRWTLMLSVPELWAANLSNIDGTLQLMAEQVGRRIGREPTDPAVRACTGAMFGIMLTVALEWAKDPDMNLVTAIDEALASLENGIPR
jgi:AcrR family transcriptional regulator